MVLKESVDMEISTLIYMKKNSVTEDKRKDKAQREPTC